jgi:hypothetical protein
MPCNISSVLKTSSIKLDQILTNFYPPGHTELSGHAGGRAMRHDEWLLMEMPRFIASGRKVFVVRNAVGWLALSEEKVAK